MNVDLIIRISVFVGIFAAMAVWEMMAPRRQWQTAKAKRWVINLALVGFNALFARTLLASGALGCGVAVFFVTAGSLPTFVMRRLSNVFMSVDLPTFGMLA